MQSRLANMVQRIKIAISVVSGRTLVQYDGYDQDTRDQVELLLPFGYVGSPIAGSDALELQIGAHASHKVVLGGDNTADALSDLQQGESGLSRGGQQVILRLTGTEIVTALLKWGPARSELKRLVHEDFMALFNAHVHPTSGGNTGAPTVMMSASELTGGS